MRVCPLLGRRQEKVGGSAMEAYGRRACHEQPAMMKLHTNGKSQQCHTRLFAARTRSHIYKTGW